MKTNYQHINSAVLRWKRRAMIEGESDDMLLRIVAHEGLGTMLTDEQYVPKVALLDVRDGKAKLPKDCAEIELVACIEEKHPKASVGMMTQWVYDAYKDCDIEINLVCPECVHGNKLEVVEIEADKLFQRDNPQMMAKNWNAYAGFGKPITDVDGVPVSNLNQQFEIMWPQTNTGSFWGADHHEACLTAKIPPVRGAKMYRIERPYLLTDFKEGQLLVSYLGYRIIDGYYAVPDVPLVYQALSFYLDQHHSYQRWMREQTNQAYSVYKSVMQDWERYSQMAYSKLQLPDQNSWIQAVKDGVIFTTDEYFYE